MAGAGTRWTETRSVQRYWRRQRTSADWSAAGAEDLRRLSRPDPAVVLAGVVLLTADQAAYVTVGSPVVLQAPLDWFAHVLTTALIVWGLAPGMRNRVLVPALIASVAIDIDHIPGRLGYDWLTAGTSRPYTHSLTTVVVLLIGAGLVRRARAPLLGVALGVASHLWRDLAEPAHAGVALVWPISDGSCEVPQTVYLGSLAALALIAAVRALRGPHVRTEGRAPSAAARLQRFRRRRQGFHPVPRWGNKQPGRRPLYRPLHATRLACAARFRRSRQVADP